MNEKTCSNCLFEYTCDWTPATGEDVRRLFEQMIADIW